MIRFNFAPLGDLHFAFFFGESTAGVEAAAIRGFCQAGGGAFEDDALARPRDAGIGDGHGGEQGLCIWVQGVVVQIVAAGKLNDNPQIHDGDPVANVAYHA